MSDDAADVVVVIGTVSNTNKIDCQASQDPVKYESPYLQDKPTQNWSVGHSDPCEALVLRGFGH